MFSTPYVLLHPDTAASGAVVQRIQTQSTHSIGPSPDSERQCVVDEYTASRTSTGEEALSVFPSNGEVQRLSHGLRREAEWSSRVRKTLGLWGSPHGARRNDCTSRPVNSPGRPSLGTLLKNLQVGWSDHDGFLHTRGGVSVTGHATASVTCYWTPSVAAGRGTWASKTLSKLLESFSFNPRWGQLWTRRWGYSQMG
ncbi:hypothetical protein PAXRUDRAFT_270768 [Paxillus rubicundulus Ve08.2h10]|uniref:Uncharacterized protein n=1 Tax=Paxillus rubicundulus Ve08.2h10 TaxID=930991 RepID=A0A0D0DXM3_9AGAM|nr:hypothetical protein PAXRUDRAFT_270768 [Paxillus rubicundulus Ve08.2h10]